MEIIMNGFSQWWEGLVSNFYKCFIREDRYTLLLSGIGVTLKVSLLAVILGILIGIVIAFCSLSKRKPIRLIGKVYTDIIRGTPSVTQLMIIYFVIFASVSWEKWIIAAIAFGINSGAYVSEIIRAGILSIDKGQTEAGRSLGLGAGQTMWLIVLPQAIKNILPALGNEFIVLVKETSIAGYIAVTDITKAAQYVGSKTYDLITPLLIAAAFYLILVFILTKLQKLLERRLGKSDRR